MIGLLSLAQIDVTLAHYLKAYDVYI